MSAQIIGTQTFAFLSLRGTPETAALELEDVSRPGVDGHAYRQVGKRGEPFEMTGVVDVDDAAAATAFVVGLKALQGTIVSVVDDHGVTTIDVALLRVTVVDRRKLLAAAGGLSTTKGVLLAVRLVMQKSKPTG